MTKYDRIFSRMNVERIILLVDANAKIKLRFQGYAKHIHQIGFI